MLVVGILCVLLIILSFIAMIEDIIDEYGILIVIGKILLGVAAVVLAIHAGEILYGVLIGLSVLLGLIGNFISMGDTRKVPVFFSLIGLVGKLACVVLIVLSLFGIVIK